jgi:hypothetical protein
MTQPFEKMPQFGHNWTRASNDQNNINLDLQQSTAALGFTLDPVYAEKCPPCLPTEVGWLGKQGVSYDNSKPLVDTESDLFNVGRILTKDPSYKFQPCQKKKCIGLVNGCEECQPPLAHLPECVIKNESTLLSNPKSTFRETGVNRFQPICLNPQDRTRWEHPGEIGINYRMIVKDNHVPCIPHPVSQTAALPKGGKLPCSNYQTSCVPPIAALNSYRQRSDKMPLNRYT